MRKALPLLLLLLCTSVAYAADVPVAAVHKTPPPEKYPPPWFTGPLLTPSSHVVPGGYINPEPYFFYTVNTGAYNRDWEVENRPDFTQASFQFPLFIGLTEWMNILIIPQANWNSTRGVSNMVPGDFTVELDFQVFENTSGHGNLALKLFAQEVFPIGKHDELDPRKFGTDIGGQGAFISRVGFTVGNLYHLRKWHYLSLRLQGDYAVFTKTPIRGQSNFGGGPDTRGTVKPGMVFRAFFGGELSLTQNWALAWDLVGTHRFKSTFRGFGGTAADGTPLKPGRPSTFNFSLAPAIEYNFSESTGVIGGCWFSFAGKNTPQFFSAVIAVNYFGPTPKTERHKFRFLGGGGGN